MRAGRLLLVGGLCGVLLAVAVAVALRLLEESRAGGAAPPHGTIAEPLTAPALPMTSPRRATRVVEQPRIVARAADPEGGPAWVVRRTVSRSTYRDRHGRVLERPANACYQLLRAWQGRLGWIDGRNRFRPVAPLRDDAAPVGCVALLVGVPPEPESVSLTTRISDPPAGGVPHALQTVRWSMGGSGRPARLEVGGAAAERAARVEYSVADPAGGLPWGLADEKSGAPGCLAAFGTLVDGRAGYINRRLDTLTAGEWGEHCRNRGVWMRPTLRRPFVVYAASESGPLPSLTDTPESTSSPRTRALRLAAGRTKLVAEAHPDVVAVTVVSPRDVRTLTPSPRSHVFAAIWDGAFPTGEIVLKARMRDGSERIQRSPINRW